MNSCRSSPCQNGANCINSGLNAYQCKCTPGYSGSECQTGSSRLVSYQYISALIDFIKKLLLYISMYDTSDINECNSSPCRYGTCIDQVNAFYCNCPADRTGTICADGINNNL